MKKVNAAALLLPAVILMFAVFLSGCEMVDCADNEAEFIAWGVVIPQDRDK
jgi:hypothetical protein